MNTPTFPTTIYVTRDEQDPDLLLTADSFAQVAQLGVPVPAAEYRLVRTVAVTQTLVTTVKPIKLGRRSGEPKA